MRKFIVLALFCCFSIDLFAFDADKNQAIISDISEKPLNSVVSSISENLKSKLFLLRSKADEISYLRFSPDGQRVQSIIGKISQPDDSSTNLEKATRFLNSNLQLFCEKVSESDKVSNKVSDKVSEIRNESENASDSGSSDIELVFKQQLSTENSEMYIFQEKISGIPVYRKTASVYFNRNGEIALIASNLTSSVRVANKRTLSSKEAKDAALKSFSQEKCVVQKDIENVLFPGENKLFDALLVQVSTQSPPGNWEIIIDSNTGAELYRENLLSFQDTHSGRAKVFRHHPATGTVTVETIENLTDSRLNGLNVYVQIDNKVGASGSNGDYFYETSNYHFDEIMAYYHLDLAWKFYSKLGFERERIGAVVLIQFMDNAYYTPWANAIFLGDGGDRFMSLAREESVLYHEFAHSIVDKIKPLRGQHGPAMSEGQADYFAASLSDDPLIGEYVVKKQNRPYLRNVENKLKFPDDYKNEPHHDGQIWSGALWDLRKKIGCEAVDRILLKSFFSISDDPLFADGLIALLQADKDHFDGKYSDSIIETFAARGICLQQPNSLSGAELDQMIKFNSIHESR
ncbi:MAG: M36 family metallopeptidase [Candidatus Riflebacteria bacterium]|nr:M36 family metallopeptidase [Candidatus Riflebacteria bacterium]